MPSRAVRYWHKEDKDTIAPFATSKRELYARMELLDLAWCDVCKVVVEPNGHYCASGLYSTCPFCCEEIDE